VSERLHQAHRGVRGGAARIPLGGCRGAEPPTRGFRGSTPEFFFSGRHIFRRAEPTYFLRADIFPGRHISGTTYYRNDIFPGPHDIRWFFDTWFFADGFLFPVKELGFWTNPGHWVRVLDAAGSYMYIVL
jgi:hypothetical protein